MAIRGVEVELGGARRLLRLDLGAWAALEDQGYDPITLTREFQGGSRRFTAIRALLWAMVQHESPAPSIGEVGGWVDGHNFLVVLPKLGEALADAFPEPSGEEPPGPPVAAGTGGNSGGLPTVP